VSAPDATRRADLAKIHIAVAELGLSEDLYRSMVEGVAGAQSPAKRSGSAGDLTAPERFRLLAEFRKLGWKPRHGGKNRPHRPVGERRGQVRKIRALWLELAELGEVRDPSEQALAAYVRRMTKSEGNPDGVAAIQFLDVPDAIRVIEAMKKWVARVNRQKGGQGPGGAA